MYRQVRASLCSATYSCHSSISVTPLRSSSRWILPQSGTTTAEAWAERGSSRATNSRSSQSCTVCQSSPAALASDTYFATTPLETFSAAAMSSWVICEAHFSRITSLIMRRAILFLGTVPSSGQSRRGYGPRFSSLRSTGACRASQAGRRFGGHVRRNDRSRCRNARLRSTEMRGHIRPKRAVTMPKWLVTMGRNTHLPFPIHHPVVRHLALRAMRSRCL